MELTESPLYAEILRLAGELEVERRESGRQRVIAEVRQGIILDLRAENAKLREGARADEFLTVVEGGAVGVEWLPTCAHAKDAA